MRPIPSPATVQIALLELDPTRTREHIYAVLAWTDHGERHDHALTPRLPSPSDVAARAGRAGAAPPKVSSAGHGWGTWLLDSIPGELRHLPPANAPQALAIRLAR